MRLHNSCGAQILFVYVKESGVIESEVEFLVTSSLVKL